MSAHPPPKTKKAKPAETETLPDAWERFERAVDVVVKVKPKPRAASRAAVRKGAAPD
jgi:hypothetical protein